MDNKKAKELLIKSGLSTAKAEEVSTHLARFYNEDKKKVKEENINEVVVSKKTSDKKIKEVLGGDK